MKAFNVVQKGDSIYSVYIDMQHQTVEMSQHIVKKVMVSNHVIFEDGEVMAFTNQDANSDITIYAGIHYFTNPAMAKRQVKIEYRRMYEMTEMMIAKFQNELELWGDNMRNWMSHEAQ